MEKHLDINHNGATLVCVTNQYQCERLINAGKIIADNTGTSLHVLNVCNTKGYIDDAAAIEHLYALSKQKGAVMTVVFSENIADEIIKFSLKANSKNIITGMPENESSILNMLWKRLKTVNFFTVSHINTIMPVERLKNESITKRV